MGSFYANCSITNRTLIEGDSTYIQLLMPREYIYETKSFTEKKGLQVSDEGPLTNYMPFGFPIKGKYDDYGKINEIIKDSNVKKLEEFFNLSIEDILEISMGEDFSPQYEKYDTIKRLNCTYFDGKIYEYMCEGWEKLPTSKPKKQDYSREYYFGEIIGNLIEYFNNKHDALPNTIQQKIDKKEKLTIEELDIYRQYITRGLGISINTYLSRYEKDFILTVGYDPKEFIDDMRKQYIFLSNLGYDGIGTKLGLSEYGGQETNWKFLLTLNRKLEEILTNEHSDIWEEYDYSENRDEEILDILSSDKALKYMKNKVNEILDKKNFLFMNKNDISKLILESYNAGNNGE
jgi:hypothetical protein